MATKENNDEIETIVYELGIEFRNRLTEKDPTKFRLICRHCGADIIYAPTFELANKYRVPPGAYCSKDRKHLTAMFNLKDPNSK